MPYHCRHDPEYVASSKKSQENRHLPCTPPYTAERQFEPWNPSISSKDRTACPPSSPPSSYTRHYGWNEIQDDEEERKRLQHLVSIWEIERQAILRLQHDLNRNLFQRTLDSIKKIGQSIGLALWLWVHRPTTTCSQMRETTMMNSYSTVSNQKILDHLPDSWWLKQFVLNKTEETLPPIARAMKNMLDQNVFIWDSNKEEEHPWPHFVNLHRQARIPEAFPTSHGKSENSLPVAPLERWTNVLKSPEKLREQAHSSISPRLLLQPPRTERKKKKRKKRSKSTTKKRNR